MRARSTSFASLALCVLTALSGRLPAQEFQLSRTSGTQIAGRPVAIRGRGEAMQLVFAAAGRELQVPVSQVLALHGAAPEVTSPVAVHLVGGDEWKGRMLGGEKGGEAFSLQSPALGPARIPVDRLATMIFRERAGGTGVEDFAISADAEHEEAIFRRVRRGFDEIPGELERFEADSILFALGRDKAARSFAVTKLAAIAIKGSFPAKAPGSWLLVTTAGDRIHVELTGITDGSFAFETEFGAIEVLRSKVAALTPLGRGRTFLSDMTPIRVEEHGSGDDGPSLPLYSFRRDHTVSGGLRSKGRSPGDGCLVVDGHTYAKGLGVHSRCVLTYRVPKDARFFHAKVAIDDEVKALGVTGDADVRVRIGKKVLFEKRGLRRGGAPLTLGRLKVTPGALLVLEVDFGKALFLGDRVDWLSAVFLR